MKKEGMGENIQQDDRHIFPSGAMSSGQKPRYDLIPLWALKRIAARFQLGARKYGVDNWQKGLQDRDFILDRINHAIEHLYILRDHVQGGAIASPSDDDAAAVVLNAIFVMGWQQRNTTTEYNKEE